MHALRFSGFPDSPSTRHILFESDPACRDLISRDLACANVLLSGAPDSKGLVGSVLSLTDDDCALLRAILDKHPNLVSVLIVGGSPCQGLSRANPHRRNLEDPRSVLIWVFAVLVARARAHLTASRSKASVHFLVENVEMEPSAALAVTQMLNTPSQHIDAALWSTIARPRVFWTSLGPCVLAPRQIPDPSSVLEAGWRPLWELSQAPANTKWGHRWCTLTRPFPAGAPPEFPVSYPRHSLNMYTEFGLAYSTSASTEQLRVIRQLIDSGMRLPFELRKSLRVRNSEAVRLRGAVAQAIHVEGLSSCLRPLLANEVERALGYPAGASGPDSGPLLDDQWSRLAHLGNGFSIQVVSALLKPFAAGATQGVSPPVIGAGPSALAPEEAINILWSLGPARSAATLPRPPPGGRGRRLIPPKLAALGKAD